MVQKKIHIKEKITMILYIYIFMNQPKKKTNKLHIKKFEIIK